MKDYVVRARLMGLERRGPRLMISRTSASAWCAMESSADAGTPWSCLGFYSANAIRAGIFLHAQGPHPSSDDFPQHEIFAPIHSDFIDRRNGVSLSCGGPARTAQFRTGAGERRISASGSHARLRAQPTPSRIVEPGNARGTQGTHKTPVINCPSPR